MTTIKEEIEQLNNEHWDGIIAPASKAENADDLNAIVYEIGKFHEHIHGGYPAVFAGRVVEDMIIQIERTITQWPDITVGLNGMEWAIPHFALSDCGRIFGKDENTVVIWDDQGGEYIECNRCDPTAIESLTMEEK